MTPDPLQLPETGQDPPPLIDNDRSAVIVLAVACGISGTIIALVLLAMRGLL